MKRCAFTTAMLSFSLRIPLVLLTTLLFSLSSTAHAEASIWRVDSNSTVPAPDGASWATAYPDIQTAINAATSVAPSENAPAEIWVAAGSYTAAEGDNVVTMAEYVHLYGGFAGDETARDQRD